MGELIAFPRPASGSRSRPEPQPAAPPLWREITGQVLRAARTRRQETLAEVAGRAGVSVPYLSEIERGRKEPSSEVLAAVVGALDLTLHELAAGVAEALRPLDLTSRGTTPGRPSGPLALAV